MQPRVYYTDSYIALGSWHHLQLATFTGPLQIPHIAISDRLRAEILAKHSKGVLGAMIVLPDVKLPTTEAREAAVQMMRRAQPTELGSAFIIEGGTLIDSAMRAAVATILLAARASKPYKVFSSIKDAVPWINQHAQQAEARLPFNELEAALHGFRDEQIAAARQASA